MERIVKRDEQLVDTAIKSFSVSIKCSSFPRTYIPPSHHERSELEKGHRKNKRQKSKTSCPQAREIIGKDVTRICH